MILTGLLVGAILGVVMQRGRFCVTGMSRDIFLQRSWRGFVALLVVIAVHAIGLAALTSTGVIAPDHTTFAPAAVIVGGFLFGLGIILAGDCASGTWYRSAEGLVGSWIALAMYALSAAAMKYGALRGLDTWMKSWDTGLTTILKALGVSPWWFVVAISVITFISVRRFHAGIPNGPQRRLTNHPSGNVRCTYTPPERLWADRCRCLAARPQPAEIVALGLPLRPPTRSNTR